MALLPVDYVELGPGYPQAIRRLAECIHEVAGASFAGIPTAADFGSGEGMLVARLTELGWSAIGYEGSVDALLRTVTGARVYPWDLRTDGSPGQFDVAICTETAEHLEAAYAHRIVDLVSTSSRSLIVWSAAQPGQEYPGHVNLQSPSYWLDKFDARGFIVDGRRTTMLRRLMLERNAQHCGAVSNFHVLSRRVQRADAGA